MEQITCDLIPGGKMPLLHASQYDEGREYRINLTENKQAYTLDGTELLTVSVRKGDNTLFTADIANTFSGKSYVDFVSTEQMCAVAGYNFGELSITKNNTRIGTVNFMLVCEPSPEASGLTSESEINNLNRQIDDYLDETLPEVLGDDIPPIVERVIDETLAPVAKSGNYNDLENKPSIPAAQVNSDWNANSGVSQILNKPNLSTVATTGNYDDLNNKPSVAVIDDAEASASKAYSSEKIENKFSELPYPATQMVAASGHNLNDYHTPACFFAETGLANLPTANDNFIILNYYAKWQNATRYNLVQLAVNATNCKTYARVYASSNNTWKSWLPLFYDATQLVADVEYNQDETDRIRQNIFGLNASKGENGFLRATGAVQANNGYVTTDYIRIYNGQSFTYRIGHGSELPVICFFTGKDKSYIVSAKTVTGIDGYVSGTFTAEQDGYVRITYSKTKNQGYVVFTDNIPDNVRLAINPNTLKDKNILCLGDSIFGNDGEIVSFINDTGAIAVNGAFGGTQVSVRTGATDNFRYFDGVNLVTALCTQDWTGQDAGASALSGTYPWVVTRLAGLKAVDMSKVDVITMDWGTNDYTSGKTIAEITTAYNTVIDLLQQYYPSVRLLIIAPIWRYFGQKSDNENGDNKVYNVSTLKEIATAIDNNAKDKRIEALQMYQNMPLSYNTADLYFDTGDKTHLNTTGNKVYSEILIGKLRSMFG